MPVDCNEGELSWHDVNNLPFWEMLHTARYVLEHYIQYGKRYDLLYAGIAQKDGVVFHRLTEF